MGRELSLSFTKYNSTNTPKFTNEERTLVKSIVATLSIKRIPDPEIIKEIERQTNKTITRMGLYYVRQSIKKDSYHWYKTMREGQYSYIHEFKERINEILDLQKRHYEIVDSPTIPIQMKQASLTELHRLSITLSNLFDVAPDRTNWSHRRNGSDRTTRTRPKYPLSHGDQKWWTSLYCRTGTLWCR